MDWNDYREGAGEFFARAAEKGEAEKAKEKANEAKAEKASFFADAAAKAEEEKAEAKAEAEV